jgi:uncharacterized CHY-type Zn-finger protein
LAAAIILIVRIVNSRQGQDSKKAKKKITKSPEKSKPALSDIKIQVGCPECSRQLRVPSNYSGSVRCPDCNHNFAVEEEHDEIQEEVVESNVEENLEEVQEVNDGKIEVGCPECSQTLRIPQSYSGSVRCPACKNIFRSE